LCCGFMRRWRPNVSIVTVLGLVGGAPGPGGGRHRAACGRNSQRAPDGGARPVPGLCPEASGSERSQCRADAPATLCGLSNDLHEA
jgi:hypothetical protein